MEPSADHEIEATGKIASIAEAIYTCVDNGDLAGAIRHLDRAIFLHPDRAYFYAERANFHSQMGDIQQAIADYDRAIELQPHNRLFKHWRSQLNDWTWGLELTDSGSTSAYTASTEA